MSKRSKPLVCDENVADAAWVAQEGKEGRYVCLGCGGDAHPGQVPPTLIPQEAPHNDGWVNNMNEMMDSASYCYDCNTHYYVSHHCWTQKI